MTSSWVAYWRERFRPRLFLPAALAITAAGRAGASSDGSAWPADVVCTLLLLAQFRLWDDLADRDRDRATHPSRVLVRASQLEPFVATCLALTVANLALRAWLGGNAAAQALVALDLAAAAWYSWRPARRTALTDLVLLTKYPAFVLLLAAGSHAPIPLVAVSAAAIYGLACGLEIWHDASGPLRVTNS